MAEQHPNVAEFLGRVQRTFRTTNPESFWDCDEAFRRLAASQFLAEVVNQEMQRLSKENHYVGNWLPAELVLHRGGGLALSVSVLEAPLRYIHTLPHHAMYAPVGRTSLVYNRYRLPDAYRNEVFDPTLALIPDSPGSVAPGNVLLARCGEFAYDFMVERPVPLLKFVTTAIHPLEWLFTRDGLRPWQANDADLTFTQLRVAADVLGKFAHQSSLGPLKMLTQHPHHAVRWAAIQNLGRMNRSEAVTRLQEAVNDPHPHVRRAAQKTLDRLKNR